VLCLPDKALAAVELALGPRAPAGKCRYAGFSLERVGDSRRAPIRVEYFGECGPALGTAIDVPAVLCRAWGMPALLEEWRHRLRGDTAAG
jgi:hypothetical protein